MDQRLIQDNGNKVFEAMVGADNYATSQQATAQ